MDKRQLGESDLFLTVIGLGTWAIGGSGWDYGWGYQDDQKSIETIQRAIELGINWVDTAHAYGYGHGEKILGKILKKYPDVVYLSAGEANLQYLKHQKNHILSHLVAIYSEELP